MMNKVLLLVTGAALVSAGEWRTTTKRVITSKPTLVYWSDKTETTWIPYTETLTYSYTETTTEYVPTTIPTTIAVPTTIPTTDTAYVEVPVTDTSYVEVPTTDTSYVEVPTTDTSYVEVPVTDTSYVEVPTTDTSYVEVPVTDTSYVEVPTTDTSYVEVPTTDTSYVEVPTTVVNVETDTETVYVTSLTTEPAVTVFITSTDTLPPETVTTTSITTTTTSQCEFCKIDIYATALRFPTSYITTTVFPITYEVFKTVYDDINSTEYSTNTYTVATECISDPPTTWSQFGVQLTSPTTYIAYTNFSHGFLEPRPTVYGCGELVFEDLNLGASASEFAELIIATTAIPTTAFPAPIQLLNYLDTIPEVTAQLSGVPAYSCDIPTASATPFVPQETAKATVLADGFDVVSAPVVHLNAADVFAAG